MLRLENHLIGVDKGENIMFSDFEHDGDMWTGKGTRESRMWVAFSSEYVRAPVVQVSLSMWDTDRLTNMRGDLQAENISNTGFDLVFKTWGDSRVARIRASWMAIGELPHGDAWDLY